MKEQARKQRDVMMMPVAMTVRPPRREKRSEPMTVWRSTEAQGPREPLHRERHRQIAQIRICVILMQKRRHINHQIPPNVRQACNLTIEYQVDKAEADHAAKP